MVETSDSCSSFILRSLFRVQFQNQQQRIFRRLFPNVIPVPRKMVLPGKYSFFICISQKDGSDRITKFITAWACQSGHRDSHICMQSLSGSHRHCLCNRCGNRAKPIQLFQGNLQKAVLDFIAVADDATFIDRGTPRYRRQCRTNSTPGAAFCRCQRFSIQPLQNTFTQIPHGTSPLSFPHFPVHGKSGLPGPDFALRE